MFKFSFLKSKLQKRHEDLVASIHEYEVALLASRRNVANYEAQLQVLKDARIQLEAEMEHARVKALPIADVVPLAQTE